MDSEELDICRVCRSEGTVDNPLFSPCVCHGTIKYVHQECLVQWLKYSKKESCELCKHPFTFIPNMPKSIPASVIIGGMAKSIYKFLNNWFHYTLVIIAWLIMVPFAASRIYIAIFYLNPKALLPSSLIHIESKRLMFNYGQGIFIVLLGLSLFMSLVWLKEQILTTEEISEWLSNPLQMGQNELFNQQQAHRQQLLRNLRANMATQNNANARGQQINQVDSSINTLPTPNNLNNVNSIIEKGNNKSINENNVINDENSKLNLQSSIKVDLPVDQLPSTSHQYTQNNSDKIVIDKISPNNPVIGDLQPLNTQESILNNNDSLNINNNDTNTTNSDIVPPMAAVSNIDTNNNNNNTNNNNNNNVINNEGRGGGGMFAGFDLFNFNNIDWDRAVEDLTWENLLGLDGTYNFLEHALWIVIFNTLFVFLFAFIPFRYGKLFYKVIGWDKRISNTHFELFLNIYLGYILIAHLFYLARKISAIFNYNKLKLFTGVCFLMIKVSLIIALEIVIFPFFCGWFLDLCSLDLFGSNITDRLNAADIGPVSSAAAHWLIGIVYVFYFASGVLILRENLRPGLMWFLRGAGGTAGNSSQEPNTADNNNNFNNNINNTNDNNDAPNVNNNNNNNINNFANNNNNNIINNDFNPIKEMITYSIFEHVRRFIFSWLLFVLVILLSVYVPSQLIKRIFPSFLPYNFISSYDTYFAELPLELILFHVILPTLLSDTSNALRAPRVLITALIQVWADRVGSLLGLRSYLLGNINSNNNNNNNVDPGRPSTSQVHPQSLLGLTRTNDIQPIGLKGPKTPSCKENPPLTESIKDKENSGDPNQVINNANKDAVYKFFIGRAFMNLMPWNLLAIFLFGELLTAGNNPNTLNTVSTATNRASALISQNGPALPSIQSDSYILSLFQAGTSNHNNGSLNGRLNQSTPYFDNTTSLTNYASSNTNINYPPLEPVHGEEEIFITDFQDIYTALAGVYILWFMWRAINRHQQIQIQRNQLEQINLNTGLGITPSNTPGLVNNQEINHGPFPINESHHNWSTVARYRFKIRRMTQRFYTNMRNDTRKICDFALKISKFLFLVFFIFGLIPLLAGILLDLCVIIPFTVPLDRTPIIVLSQNWMLGLLLVKSLIAFSLLYPTPIFLDPHPLPQPRPAIASANENTNNNNNDNDGNNSNNNGNENSNTPNYVLNWNRLSLMIPNVLSFIHPSQLRRFYDEVARILTYGYSILVTPLANEPGRGHVLPTIEDNQLHLSSIWCNLVWPIIKILGLMLTIPFACVQTLGALLGLDEMYQNWLIRLIFPSIFSLMLGSSLMSFTIRQMRKLYQHIKDDRYLIGRRLVNLENRPGREPINQNPLTPQLPQN